jgi:DNA-binding CsgD family transcriptional regulator/PAS domain-containing protein
MPLQNSLAADLTTYWLEAITTPHRYAEGLQKMAEMLQCDHASLAVWGCTQAWGNLYQATRVDNHWKLSMNEHALPAAQLQRLVTTISPDTWKILERSQHEQMRTHAVLEKPPRDSLVCIRIIDTHEAQALFCLQKNTSDWRTEKEALQLASHAIKPLKTALSIAIKIRNLTQKISQFSSLLDCIRMPVFLIDSDMHLLVNNAAAKSLLNVDCREAHRIAISNIAGVQAERIAPLVRRACGESGAFSAGALQIHAACNQHAMQIVILPINIKEAASRAMHHALVLIDMQAGSHASADLLLQHIYGLTPAEARLAILILRGESPASAAIRLQVSLPTIRTQLSAVLKKTGALRQADLVRRLSSLLLIN